MNKVAIAVASVLAVGAPAAFAQGAPYYDSYSTPRLERDSYEDHWRFRERDRELRREEMGRVLETRPLYDVSETRLECWNPRTARYEEVRGEERQRIGKGAAIGALAGGVLGHQIDQGGGTAAGAIVGGLLGHHVEGRRNRDDRVEYDASRCRSLGDPGDVRGYWVRYEYKGQEYVTQLDHEPGRWLRPGDQIAWDGRPKDEANNFANYEAPTYVPK